MTSPLFAAFNNRVAEELDDQADQLVGAVDGVIECMRMVTGDADQPHFEAMKLRALSMLLAGAIGHPHQDQDQHAEILGLVIEELHRELGLVGVQTLAGLKRLWRTGVQTGRILQVAEQADAVGAH